MEMRNKINGTPHPFENESGYFVFEIQYGGGCRHCVSIYGDNIQVALDKLPENCSNFGLVEIYENLHEADKFIQSCR